MNKRVKSQRTFWCLLPSFTRRSLILLLSAVFLSSVAATRSMSVQIAQKPETASTQATRAVALVLSNEGLELLKQGTAESKRQALEKWKQALPLWQQLDDKKFEAVTLNGIGIIYRDLGDKQQALNYLNQALPLWRKLDQKAREAGTFESIALLYESLGDKQQALKFYNSSLALWRQIDKKEEARTLNTIGGVYDSLGEKQQALNYLNQALLLSQQLQDNVGQARNLVVFGNVYNSLGEKQQALNKYNSALSLYQQLGDKLQQALTLNNIGLVYASLGDKQQALNKYNSSLALSEQVDNKGLKATTLNNIGSVYYDLDDKQQALKSLSKALLLSRQVQDKPQEATTLSNLGAVHDALGNNQQALNLYNQSLPLRRQVSDKAGEATTLNNIGKVYDSLGDKQQALKYFNQSLPLSRQVGDKAQEARTLYNIASVKRDKGNLQQALTQIQTAIKIIEDLRTKVDRKDLRTSYFASKQDVYKFYIDLLMQLHKKDPSIGYNALSLHASESSRARVLIELLTEARANIRSYVDPKLLAEEKRLQQLIDARGKLLQEASGKPAQEKLQKEVENLLTQQKELETKIRTTSPKYAALQYPQPLTLPQIQQQLDKDTLLLEYSLGDKHSYLWAVTPNSIDTYELPKREEIEKAVTPFRETLIKCQKIRICNQFSPEEKAQALKNTASSATKLSQIILAPVAEKLGKKRLVIVADGELQKIPFAALNDLTPQHPNLLALGEQDKLPSPRRGGVGGEVSYQPLIINHEIVNLPSVTAIATHRLDLKGRKTAPLTLAVLADPVFEATDMRITGKPESIVDNSDFRGQIEQSDLKRGAKNLNRNGWERLKATRTEAIAILNIIPNSNNLQAFDFDANYNWVTNKQLSQYRFLHFATHGFADPKNPELSGIILSLVDKQGKPADRGYLQLGDIFNLDFGADLIVLSACETGLGKDVNGEGLVGLTRGLMYAGAERVGVSLWQVDDAGTAELMQEFYTQMLKQGKLPTVALRGAQLKLWENSSWKNPYYWSAFTLQGEWR
ncbi:CHAT domain-containing protein [Plectonema radiosum NIES-515]|uniref:CHAT domain-containing protein n=1 Tax=Plectonema radiosum NIES-515 TaxID=2986073 RepID=A0ABT3AXG7_9CYAN|nr:CHAT domain-containing tetratricopeptide repeat protein [Plectonema radiosum]MCV3213811.1 CHAT domain-containing protein [Plectonema radiosum NIES-515]